MYFLGEFDGVCCGISPGQFDGDDFSAVGPDNIGSDDFLAFIVFAFHKDVGLNQFDKFIRGVFPENDDAVDEGKRCKNNGTGSLLVDRPVRSFDAPHRVVGIKPHKENIAKVPGFGEIFHMPQVKYIKTSV